MDRGTHPHDETHHTNDRPFDNDLTDRRVPDRSTTTATCPECDSRVITSSAETVCRECGLIIEDQRIDYGPEWRFADDTAEQVRRTGAPRTEARHDDGLSTVIGYDKVDGSWRQRAQVARLRTQQRRTQIQAGRERNCVTGLSEIRRTTANQEITRGTRDRACRLFRRAQADDELYGRSVEALAAGAVYAACRLHGEIRTLSEITESSRCSRQKVRLGYQILCRAYGLPVEPYPVTTWVDRIASACDLSPRARKRALDVAVVAVDAGITTGCQHGGVAAACVYEAAQAHPPTARQKDIAAAAETTPTTLRARWQELVDVLEQQASTEGYAGVDRRASA